MNDDLMIANNSTSGEDVFVINAKKFQMIKVGSNLINRGSATVNLQTRFGLEKHIANWGM